MEWKQKDSLDLLLMAIGAIMAGTFAVVVLHFVFIPYDWAKFGVPAFAVIGGYTLRWAAWRSGVRKQF
ncbi:hypothetical protein RPSD_52440 (plasmid) [Ralstonia solanacearum]|nr:hypothetical protein RPSD_52440 [Ralstonia solanacearum]